MELMTGRVLDQRTEVFEAVEAARKTLAGWSDKKALRVGRYLKRIGRIGASNEGGLLFEKPNRKTYLSKLTHPQQTAIIILQRVFVEFADGEHIKDLHVLLQKQTADSLRLKATKGEKYSEQQKKFRKDRQKVDDEKHEQWRKWQLAEKASNPQFARLKSKQAQAKRLKEKHSIPDKVDTIAKRLK